jgi:fructose-bisphosphate aldolase class I
MREGARARSAEFGSLNQAAFANLPAEARNIASNAASSGRRPAPPAAAGPVVANVSQAAEVWRRDIERLGSVHGIKHRRTVGWLKERQPCAICSRSRAFQPCVEHDAVADSARGWSATSGEDEIMANDKMMAQMSSKPGFIAALDQSGGSTPGALRLYGIAESEYSGEAEMFRLMHEMRVRIMTAPAFTGDKVIAAILFERTMDGEAKGRPVPTFLWEDRGVVPFLKVDKGLEPEKDGVSLMKPMPDLEPLLVRAVKLGVFGTKMRSVINLPSKEGIGAIARQQFEIGEQIARHGLMPILEPEVSIKSPDKAGAEKILLDELTKGLDALPPGRQVIFKLTIPEVPDFYAPLISDKRVARVVALSGGYTRAEACKRLAANHGMIASFSRALAQDLRRSMSDAEFNKALADAIDEIYRASTVKV